MGRGRGGRWTGPTPTIIYTVTRTDFCPQNPNRYLDTTTQTNAPWIARGLGGFNFPTVGKLRITLYFCRFI
jgi:hypothetical protein